MTSNKVNIFDFATSELSHDAILCYILSLFDSENLIEKEISRRLYYQMLGDEYKKHISFRDFLGFNFECDGDKIGNAKLKLNFLTQQKQIEYDTEVNSKKKGFIDIFIELKINKEKYQFVIEDKIEASEHGNQLKEYVKAIKKDYQNPKFVFITLGLKSINYLNSVRDEGNWTIIDSKIILETLSQKSRDSIPIIIRQYLEFITAISEETKSFEGSKVNSWNFYARQGFFESLEIHHKSLNIKGWGYVPNPSGGFMGCWFHYSDNLFYEELKYKYQLYLQLELSDYSNRIALKIVFSDFEKNVDKSDNTRQKVRNLFISKVLARSTVKNNLVKFVKTRKSMGTYVTIAEIDLKNLCDKEVVNHIINAIIEFDEIIKFE